MESLKKIVLAMVVMAFCVTAVIAQNAGKTTGNEVVAVPTQKEVTAMDKEELAGIMLKMDDEAVIELVKNTFDSENMDNIIKVMDAYNDMLAMIPEAEIREAKSDKLIRTMDAMGYNVLANGVRTEVETTVVFLPDTVFAQEVARRQDGGSDDAASVNEQSKEDAEKAEEEEEEQLTEDEEDQQSEEAFGGASDIQEKMNDAKAEAGINADTDAKDIRTYEESEEERSISGRSSDRY